MTDDKKLGFVALKSLKQGAPDPAAALAEIRRIYFKTTKRTIQHDLVHAIELLKSLGTEEEREKATVYMHGLNEMYRNWKSGEVEKLKSKLKSSKARSGKSASTKPRSAK
jgi:hypothetical protein